MLIRFVLKSLANRSLKSFARISIRDNNNNKKKKMSSKDIILNDITCKVLPTPVKSANDKKTYKVIRLANGLTACLISDTANIKSNETDDDSTDTESDAELTTTDEDTTDQSVSESESTEDEGETDTKHFKIPEEEQKMAATGLCIGVGSFSDIKEVPGLAHFLEHMVFMGSEKFPQENDFDSFIKKRGGFDNAATDSETTVFYFECLEKHLFRALDKFSQFFISPLMKRSSMTREREAVESEFQMSVPSDSARKDQLISNMFNIDVPINQFSWGNLKTLRDDVTEDVLYEKLHEFRKRHYSAHRMTLAIQARLPMDELEEYVLKCFSAVPNNNLPADNFEMYEGKIFNKEKFSKLYHIEPVKETLQVDLLFALPPLLKKYRTKPDEYISWLLGHEGKGSLISYLRKKLWVLSICTGNDGSGSDHNSIFSLFIVNMVLTEDGYDHLSDVISAMFSYIKIICADKRLFDEMKLIEDTSFRFAEEEDAGEFVEELCENMYFYPPEDYLTGSELFFEYSPEDINLILSYMTPENMLITVLNSDTVPNLIYDQIEPWFGSKYSIKDIPKEWLNDWKNVQIYADFHLPSPNQFLTTNFDLLPIVDDLKEYPIKLLDTDMLELWYRKDQKFNLPIAYYYFHLILPSSNKNSALDECMNQMAVLLLSFQLNEEIYPASIAQLSYKLYASSKNFVIKVDGFNEKLPILIELIGKYFINLAENLNEEMFIALKDKLLKLFHNKFIKPAKFAKELRLVLLLENFSSSIDKYRVMNSITFEMMRDYCKHVVDKLYIQALVQGNVDAQVATSTVQNFANILKCQSINKKKLRKYRVYQLPKGINYCKMKSFNSEDTNSIVTNYYQTNSYDIKETVIIELLMMIIQEPLFDTLRTKEQLGYDVHCLSHETYGIMGYSITVNTQIIKNSVTHVDNRIELFIKSISKMLKKLSDKKFNQIKIDLINVKQCVDLHLKEEVERNWIEVVKDEYFFNRSKEEIKAIETIKLSDIRKWWDDYNLCGNDNNCRKLSIQVEGHKYDRDNLDNARDDTKIDSIRNDDGNVNEKTYKVELIDNGNDNDRCYIKSIENFQKQLTLYDEYRAVPRKE